MYEARADVHRARTQRLAAMRDVPSQTLDGTAIHLAANIEMLEEIPIAVELGAEAVGLFRTEFLYLERSDLPSEDEQYAHAVAALKSVGGRCVTFRTLDLGGDKLPPSVRIPSGTNPAMGLRSIRFSLHREDVFRIQLRALYRAAAVGPMQIMFPLISGVAELRAAKRVCAEVCAELARAGTPHADHVPLGVMIETPSAAFIADLLAAECDFLSIGTNDLIQYSLAADREDEHVGYLYHPLHPAILRALRAIAVAAERAGKPVAMCGDMAGDPVAVLGADRPRDSQPLDGAAPDSARQIDRPLHAHGRRRAPARPGARHVDRDRDRGAGLRRDGQALSARAHRRRSRRRRGAAGGVTANPNVPALRVRRAYLDDWPSARALFREGDDFHADIAPDYFRSGARPEDEWRRLLEDGTGVVFLAEVPGEGAVGLVAVRIYDTPDNPAMVPRRRGHVETVVVAAGHRRRGIGRRLMGEAAAWARVHGAVEIVLTIWGGNAEAEAFYERLGYGRCRGCCTPRSTRSRAERSGGGRGRGPRTCAERAHSR